VSISMFGSEVRPRVYISHSLDYKLTWADTECHHYPISITFYALLLLPIWRLPFTGKRYPGIPPMPFYVVFDTHTAVLLL
jgi:hypothetical protein